MKPHHLQMLSDAQLNKLTTIRLLGVLKSARAVESAEQGWRRREGICCEVCNEWILGEKAYKKMVLDPTAELTTYKNKIKEILATREHVI